MIAAMIHSCLASPGLLAALGAAQPGDAVAPAGTIEVRSMAALEALPLGTRALRVHGLGDDALPALQRLRGLESLEMHGAVAVTLGGRPEARVVSLTDNAFANLARLSKLRRLCLDTHPALSGVGLDELQRLPVLEALALRNLDVDDSHFEALSRLPSLTELDLSCNYGLRDAGIAALQACGGLRRLTLRGCQQLHGADIARLGTLSRLEFLDLSGKDRRHWRPDFDLRAVAGVDVATRTNDGKVTFPMGDFPALDTFGPSVDEMRRENAQRRWQLRRLQYRHLAQAAARPPRHEIDDAALGSLAAAPLRELHLPAGGYTATGFHEFRAARTLEVLVLDGGGLNASMAEGLPRTLHTLVVRGGVDDDACVALRRALPRLRHLELSGSAALTTAGLAELVQVEDLRHLGLGGCEGLLPTAIGILSRAHRLEELDLRGVSWVVPTQLDHLRAALPGLRTLHAGTADTDPQPSTWLLRGR